MSEFLTRQGACALLQQHGIPISVSTLEKLALQSCDLGKRERYNGGPPIAAYVPGPGRSGRRPF